MNEAKYPTESLVCKTWLREKVMAMYFSNYAFNTKNEEDEDMTW